MHTVCVLVLFCGPKHTTRSGHLPPPPGANALCLAGWLANSHRPAVQDGPVQLAPTLVHLPALTPVLRYRPGGRNVPRCPGNGPRPVSLLPQTQAGPRSSGRVRRCPGWSGQPGTRRGRRSRRWTTGEPPSCPGWTELVGSGGG